MKVNIIIAGFQKCGTTALHSFLTDHPRIVGSKPKETDYFNSEFRFEQGERFYHSYYKHRSFNPFKKQVFLDSSPSYLHRGNVELTAKRILEYNPDIKVIGLVRNPVDRAYSAWNMYRKNFEKGKENWWFEWKEKREGKEVHAIKRDKAEFEDFHHFISRELECLKNNQAIECPVLPIGHYRGVNTFKSIFKDSFLLLKNEDLKLKTVDTLEAVSEFLGLKTHDWTKFEGKKVFSGTYKRKISAASEKLLTEYYKID